MMLLRYLSQIGKYFLMWKEIFNKQTKWSVMKGLIFKEIDDLIIDSLRNCSLHFLLCWWCCSYSNGIKFEPIH